MPVFQSRERKKVLLGVAKILLPTIYATHASNLTRRDDEGYTEYVAHECLRASEAFVVALEGIP
jgi:hypothetical protein